MLTKSLPIAYRNLDRPSCMSKLIDFLILSEILVNLTPSKAYPT